MAAFEVLALDPTTPQIRAPGASDTYSFPRSVELPLGTANGVLYLNGSKVATSGSALTFDGTNLGLGVTPSAWSGVTALQIASSGAIGGNNQYLDVTTNAYYNAGYKYIGTGLAAKYGQALGQHQWFTAPSGTAGNAITFTQAMTLSSDGTFRVKGAGTAGSTDAVQFSGSAPASSMTLSAAGNLLVGVTSDANSARGVFGGSVIATTNSISTFSGDYVGFDRTASKNLRIFSGTGDATGSVIEFYTGVSGSISERARITSTGNQIDSQPAESAQNSSVTLTVANLQAQIITSNAAVTLTLPTGTNLDTYTTSMTSNTAFEVVFIATTASAITIAANGNTTVGSLTVSGNTSGTFRFRKTAANTFTVYRVA
jgi:hypothetical protein